MKTASEVLRTAFVALAMAAALSSLPDTGAALAGNIYDSQVLERMALGPEVRARVRKVLRQSQQEVTAVFRKYGIDPNARPEFDKLKAASSELQAVESREKREMKAILSREQYKVYLGLLQQAAARVIKATRNDAD